MEPDIGPMSVPSSRLCANVGPNSFALWDGFLLLTNNPFLFQLTATPYEPFVCAPLDKIYAFPRVGILVSFAQNITLQPEVQWVKSPEIRGVNNRRKLLIACLLLLCESSHTMDKIDKLSARQLYHFCSRFPTLPVRLFYDLSHDWTGVWHRNEVFHNIWWAP